jgi:hypothetical protein
MTAVPLVAAGLFLVPEPARATTELEFADGDQFTLDRTWTAADLGLPEQLGGMLFSDDGKTLYIVAAAEETDSAVYAVPVTRDKKTQKVTALGPASDVKLVFQGDPDLPGLDAGLAYGPGKTLFYTYYNVPDSRQPLAQRPHGFRGEEVIHELADLTFVGEAISGLSGLAFPPHKIHGADGADDMLISFYGATTLYSLGLRSNGKGIYEPTNAAPWATLPEDDFLSLGGMDFVPNKSKQDRNDLIYVAYDTDQIKLIEVDSTTMLPIDSVTGKPTLGTTNPVIEVFATGPDGWYPWSLTFDKRSGDLFVDTWHQVPSDTIHQISGFQRR